eukprot:s968_g17.t1
MNGYGRVDAQLPRCLVKLQSTLPRLPRTAACNFHGQEKGAKTSEGSGASVALGALWSRLAGLPHPQDPVQVCPNLHWLSPKVSNGKDIFPLWSQQ